MQTEFDLLHNTIADSVMELRFTYCKPTKSWFARGIYDGKVLTTKEHPTILLALSDFCDLIKNAKKKDN